MKEVNGIWLPDHEQHLLEYAARGPHGKWTYQFHKLEAVMQHVRDLRCAIDVGAHCGLWSKELAKLFVHVISFEPLAEHRECYMKNVHGIYTLHDCALGERDGTCSITTAKGSSGDSWVEGDGAIPVRRMDDLVAEPVDLVKLDCEGYEYFALRGGERTLLLNRPAVIVEQKPGRADKFGLKTTQAVDYLQSLGAKLREEIAGDYILSWDT
jgi:FkbM family methyltransferase